MARSPSRHPKPTPLPHFPLPLPTPQPQPHHPRMPAQPKLSASDRDTLLATLATRFAQHPERHPDIPWAAVLARLNAQPAKLLSLHQMESSGGQPDVVALDASSSTITFVDCSPESPKGRTSLAYDRAGLESRKEHRPVSSAIDTATSMGITLLSESEYFALQSFGHFDLKTSSWILTPPEFRSLGGALFGDRRFNRIFIYHNGAQSYYSVRGFRAKLDL